MSGTNFTFNSYADALSQFFTNRAQSSGTNTYLYKDPSGENLFKLCTDKQLSISENKGLQKLSRREIVVLGIKLSEKPGALIESNQAKSVSEALEEMKKRRKWRLFGCLIRLVQPFKNYRDCGHFASSNTLTDRLVTRLKIIESGRKVDTEKNEDQKKENEKLFSKTLKPTQTPIISEQDLNSNTSSLSGTPPSKNNFSEISSQNGVPRKKDVASDPAKQTPNPPQKIPTPFLTQSELPSNGTSKYTGTFSDYPDPTWLGIGDKNSPNPPGAIPQNNTTGFPFDLTGPSQSWLLPKDSEPETKFPSTLETSRPPVTSETPATPETPATNNQERTAEKSEETSTLPVTSERPATTKQEQIAKKADSTGRNVKFRSKDDSFVENPGESLPNEQFQTAIANAKRSRSPLSQETTPTKPVSPDSKTASLPPELLEDRSPTPKKTRSAPGSPINSPNGSPNGSPKARRLTFFPTAKQRAKKAKTQKNQPSERPTPASYSLPIISSPPSSRRSNINALEEYKNENKGAQYIIECLKKLTYPTQEEPMICETPDLNAITTIPQYLRYLTNSPAVDLTNEKCQTFICDCMYYGDKGMQLETVLWLHKQEPVIPTSLLSGCLKTIIDREENHQSINYLALASLLELYQKHHCNFLGDLSIGNPDMILLKAIKLAFSSGEHNGEETIEAAAQQNSKSTLAQQDTKRKLKEFTDWLVQLPEFTEPILLDLAQTFVNNGVLPVVPNPIRDILFSACIGRKKMMKNIKSNHHDLQQSLIEFKNQRKHKKTKNR